MGLPLPWPDRRQPQVRVRRAMVDDLDAMLEIGLSALPQDPQWHYRFPRRLELPDYTLCFTKKTYLSFLEDRSGRWTVMLAEAVDGTKPIAMSIWETTNVPSRLLPGNERRILCSSSSEGASKERTKKTPHKPCPHHPLFSPSFLLLCPQS